MLSYLGLKIANYKHHCLPRGVVFAVLYQVFWLQCMTTNKLLYFCMVIFIAVLNLGEMICISEVYIAGSCHKKGNK